MQGKFHPFIFYFRSTDRELQHHSFCCFSDGPKYTTITVYALLKVLIHALKNACPRLVKLHYISDGCAGQHKNKFNFLNPLHHEQDFHIKAEWHFFATSHCKNACNGIGGTVKRATAKDTEVSFRPNSDPPGHVSIRQIQYLFNHFNLHYAARSFSGGNRSVREVSASCDPFWNTTFPLVCTIH